MADDETRHDDWLAYTLSRFLGFSGEAVRMLAPDGDPADRWMLFRRVVEYEAACGSASADDESPGPDSRAEPGFEESWARTDAELRAAELGWLRRYDARPATAREFSDLDLMFDARVQPETPLRRATGIDGTRYLAASREGEPAVVTLTDAGVLQTVDGFRDLWQQRVWMDGREYGRSVSADGLPVPATALTSCLIGPDFLARQDERVLAWLLQDPGAARQATAGLEPHAFSSHSRAEIFLAWRSAAEKEPAPAPGEVRHELARRLLRAPAWAASSVGWPFGHIGLAYFDRLAVTPVTADQAAAALGVITREAAAGQGVPAVPPQADPRSLLGRAAARGLVIPALQVPAPRSG